MRQEAPSRPAIIPEGHDIPQQVTILPMKEVVHVGSVAETPEIAGGEGGTYYLLRVLLSHAVLAVEHEQT